MLDALIKNIKILWYIPTFSKSLFSVKETTKQNFRVVFYGKECQIQEGYAACFCELNPNMNKDKVWKFILIKYSLQKINAFLSLLAHQKILSAKNLKRRNIETVICVLM